MTVAESLKSYRAQFFLALLLLAVLYRGVVPDMVRDWYEDANYSHGFVVPFIAGYFAYERRRELAETVVEPWRPGFLLLLLAVFQLVLGWLGTEFFTMRSSLVVAVCGMTLFLFGKALFRRLLFPLAYLIFMVPLPYIIYDMVAFPLKLFVTRVSIASLKLLGVVVMREGNIIMLPSTTLEVADACSGIRSLISLLAISVAFAFYLDLPNGKKVFLVAAAVPIAIAANAMRVIGTGLLARFWGAKAAEGFFHEFAGLAVFLVAIALMVALGSFLSRKEGA